MHPPFQIVQCSWPRPITEANRCWTSEPDWDAPPMPFLPQPRWELLWGEACYTVDWREFFRTGLKPFDIRQSGEMRRFHMIFHIRPAATGKLVFYDDDGSIIRRNGSVIHCDRTAHGVKRSEIDVTAGELLEIAQWQLDGSWTWGAAPAPAPELARECYFQTALDQVQSRLAQPDGPPLKIYTQGACPARAALAIYSMILRGYSPRAVLLYGDYQWSHETRAFFQRVLPFAAFVPTSEVLGNIRRFGGGALEQLAQRHWFVMKTCIGLLCEPREFCLMDDDLFILDNVRDAIDALKDRAFVFAPDADYEQLYVSLWGGIFGRSSLPGTRRLNTGLFWMRNPHDPQRVAALLLRGSHNLGPMGLWEQGFFAALFAGETTLELPTQRYFYPLFDGLPGGILGYDYARNPCGFASVHFGGLVEKPGDTVALALADQVLHGATGVSNGTAGNRHD
jgi:hypothetical protein